MRRTLRPGPVMLASVILIAFCWRDDFPILRGPYLGQKPPGETPEIFAAEILSEYEHAFCSIFSPCGHEFYFVADADGNESADILRMRKVNMGEFEHN